LLAPLEAAAMPEGAEAVTIPHVWAGMPDGGPRGAYGTGTYVRKLSLPGCAQQYALRIGKLRAVYHFYAVVTSQGASPMVHDLGGNGTPGLRTEAGAKGRLFVADLPTGAPEVTLVVQVSNHIFSHAGFLWAPKLGPADAVHAGQDRRVAGYYGFTGLLVAVGMVTALLSFWHPGSGYYCIGGGLLVLLASRVMLVNNYIWIVAPDFPLEIALRLEYLGLFLLMPGFYWLVLRLYPDEASQSVARFIGGVAGIAVLVAFVSPLPVLFSLRDPYIAFSLIGLALILLVFLRAVQNGRKGARWAVAGVLVAGLGAVLDIYFYIPVPRTSLETLPFAGLAFATVLLSLFTVRYRLERIEKERLSLRLEQVNDELTAHARRVEAAQAEAAAALDMKNTFLSNISHEVQTPLRAIVNFADRLLEDGTLPEGKKRDYLTVIRGNGKNLASLMEDILSVADLEIGRFEVTPVAVDAARVCDTVVAIVEPAAHEKQLFLDISCPPAPMLIDDRIMRQAVIKILSNAIKYSPLNGVVTMRGSLSDHDYILTIMDTGPGMQAADIPVAMSLLGKGPVKEGADGGSGLGLPLVARFMGLLGGSIKIDSIPGLGTTVVLSFPLRPVMARDQAAPASEDDSPQTG
jgi:signal transduction histidine kinase